MLQEEFHLGPELKPEGCRGCWRKNVLGGAAAGAKRLRQDRVWCQSSLEGEGAQWAGGGGAVSTGSSISLRSLCLILGSCRSQQAQGLWLGRDMTGSPTKPSWACQPLAVGRLVCHPLCGLRRQALVAIVK